MAEHGNTNVVDLHEGRERDRQRAMSWNPVDKVVSVRCSICGHSWLAGESLSLDPGSFVREDRGLRARCPVCEAHCRLVW